MTVAQRRLLLSALALMLFGIGYGAVYTYRVDHQTLLVLREGYQEAFAAAAARDLSTARNTLYEAKKANRSYVRSIHIHTHLIKLSIVVLLVALLFPLVPVESRKSHWLALGLVAGVLLFPLGVYLQIHSTGLAPKALAAVGAVLVIACFAHLGIEINRGLKQADPDDT